MPTRPIRPPTSARSTNRRDWRCYALAVGIFCILTVPAVAQQGCTASPSCTPQFNLSAYYGGQDITINECIDQNSPSCAWADAVTVPTMADAAKYFLACPLPANGNSIALCYYSGVPGYPEYTPKCTVSQDGNAAECDCYEINVNNPFATGTYSYSYVEITSILNKEIYDQTVSECEDPETGDITCLTLDDVHQGISNTPAPTLCGTLLNNYNDGLLTSNPNGIFPGADLVSDFSEIGNNTSQNNKIPPPLSTPYACPLSPATMDNYAACMTAPCSHTGKIDPLTKLPLARCTCPTFDGPNQVGNPQIDPPPVGPPLSCSPAGPTALHPFIWSSANVEVMPPN